MKFSSLAALKVVILTTFGAASDENFIKMMTFSFQCACSLAVPADRILTAEFRYFCLAWILMSFILLSLFMVMGDNRCQKQCRHNGFFFIIREKFCVSVSVSVSVCNLILRMVNSSSCGMVSVKYHLNLQLLTNIYIYRGQGNIGAMACIIYQVNCDHLWSSDHYARYILHHSKYHL